MDMYVEVLQRIQSQYVKKAQELGLLDASGKSPRRKSSKKSKRKTFKDKQKGFSAKCQISSEVKTELADVVQPKKKEIREESIKTAAKKSPAKSDLTQKEKAAVIKLKMEKLSNEEVMESLNITEDALMGVLNECKKFGIKF